MRSAISNRAGVTPRWPEKVEGMETSKRASLTMPARVKTFFMNFCSLFSFFGHTIPFTPKSGLLCSVKLCFDDHGSFVIFRSVSVRPRQSHRSNFDHDYFFKLPL